jgi:hypothetical protein
MPVLFMLASKERMRKDPTKACTVVMGKSPRQLRCAAYLMLMEVGTSKPLSPRPPTNYQQAATTDIQP